MYVYVYTIVHVHNVILCTCSYTYSIEYASVVSSEYCHHSSVTSLCWRHGTMATGSWDSTVKVGVFLTYTVW